MQVARIQRAVVDERRLLDLRCFLAQHFEFNGDGGICSYECERAPLSHAACGLEWLTIAACDFYVAGEYWDSLFFLRLGNT